MKILKLVEVTAQNTELLNKWGVFLKTSQFLEVTAQNTELLNKQANQ